MTMTNKDTNTQRSTSARVFMGPKASREVTLDSLQIQSMSEWRKSFEQEYMERVKKRATEQIKSMLKDAEIKTKAIRSSTANWVEEETKRIQQSSEEAANKHTVAETLQQEAQKHYDTASHEGYQHGVEKAMLEMEEHRHDLDMAYVSVLRAIEEQCDNIFATWRQDLIALLLDSVHASIAWVLGKERQKTLEALFDNAVQQLTEQRRLYVKVHPNDAVLVQDVLNAAKTRFPELRSWNVETTTNLTPGSLSVESHTGYANNDMQHRIKQLQELLQRLELPKGDAEIKAMEAITKADADAGIPILAERINARLSEESEAIPSTPETIPDTIETMAEAIPDIEAISDITETMPDGAESLQNSLPEYTTSHTEILERLEYTHVQNQTDLSNETLPQSTPEENSVQDQSPAQDIEQDSVQGHDKLVELKNTQENQTLKNRFLAEQNALSNQNIPDIISNNITLESTQDIPDIMPDSITLEDDTPPDEIPHTTPNLTDMTTHDNIDKQTLQDTNIHKERA